jgi:membrane fusion protein (multidrug efflux system)
LLEHRITIVRDGPGGVQWLSERSAVSILFLTAFLAGCGGEAPTAPPPAPVPVRVETVSAAPLGRFVEAVGVVAAVDTVEIRSEVVGMVASVHFTDGQAVKKGDILVRLHDADARAAVLDADARAMLAKLSLERTQALFERDDVAQADVDRAQADDALARAAVQRANEALRRTTIVAPFDGVVGRRDVSPGQTVDNARVLTRVEALDQLVVDVALPESDLSRVATGQKAFVDVPALGATELAGSVRYVAPRVRDDSRTVDVRVAIEADGGSLRPGMTASVRIVTAEVGDAILVPTQAVVRSGDRASVWVVGADGTVAPKPVELGVRTADRVEVVSGLAPGDAVVVEGLSRMRPGVKVEPTPEITAR